MPKAYSPKKVTKSIICTRLAFTFVSLIVLLVNSLAHADGTFVSPEEMDLWEPNQLGLIVWDGEREDLYLMVDFVESNGQSLSRFGWILALPNVPTAEEISKDLFVELMDMTRPYERESSPFELSCQDSLSSSAPGAGDMGGIQIEGEISAGGYEITVVSSDDPEPLRTWIAEKGFHLEPAADPILEWYIDKGWRFLAIDVDLVQATEDGVLKPLKLSFETDTPVFPLRISAINGLGGSTEGDYDYGTETQVLIYIVADEFMETTNRVTDPEFHASFSSDRLDAFPTLKNALPSQGVITKLRFYASPAEMVDDVYFGPALETAGISLLTLLPSQRHVTFFGFLLVVVIMVARLFRRNNQ